MKSRLGQQVVWTIFFSLIRPFVRPIVGYTYQRAMRIQGPAIVLCNHNLDIDIGLLGLSYRQSMRVVASEHIFRLGILTALVKLFFAPIVRMKGKTEVRTVRDILRVLKKGGRVCIFPEGNRSYNGLTGEITKATASLVRMSRCQLITYRIEGGYFKHPRWAKYGRRGPTRGYEVGRYSPAELAAISPDDVLALIRRDLHEDAYARQRRMPGVYRGKKLAEGLETALYLCPKCHRIGTLHSEENRIACDCGFAMRYTVTGRLESADGEDERFTTITDWDAWQESKTAELAKCATSGSITEDADISLYRVEPCKGDELIETGVLSINQKALVCGSCVFPLAEISDLAIVGVNTLVFEIKDGGYFELRSKSAYNALKYRRFYIYCKTIAKGECGAVASIAQ